MMNMIRNRFLQFVLYVVIFALVWNLMDFLWDLLLTHETAPFTVWNNVLKPLLLGAVVVGGTTAYMKKKTQKKQK